ncbi:MAG: DUF1501 domain-containing protein, partial [Phycisphaerales bacterium]
MLRRCACGFGAAAFTGMLGDLARAAGTAGTSATIGRAPGATRPFGPQFRPTARSVVFLSLDGGPSQRDTFD